MPSYTIDSIDSEKKHVTFTITLDNGEKHQDTRCDLPLDNAQNLKDVLASYTKEFSEAKAEEARQVEQADSLKSLVGNQQSIETDE